MNTASAQVGADKSTITSIGQFSSDDDADRQTISQLKAQGSDVTKPTDVIFYLYFHTQAEAEALRPEIAKMGFTVDVHSVDNPSAWAVVANKTMTPSEAGIIDMSHQFTALATAHSGIYDGWEAALVK